MPLHKKLFSFFNSTYSLKRIAFFFIASLCGVLCDLLIFYVMNLLGVHLFITNLVSSSLAIIVTYYVSTAILFINQRTTMNFTVVYLWYAFSINFFSFFIGFLNHHTALSLFYCKVISLPVSFFANYTFNSIFFMLRRQHA